MGNYGPNLLGTIYLENPDPVFKVGDSLLCVVAQILDGGENTANRLI